MLLDRGLLRQGAGRSSWPGPSCRCPSRCRPSSPPGWTRLPSEEKLLVQDAAVVGRAFWLGALAEVAAPPAVVGGAPAARAGAQAARPPRAATRSCAASRSSSFSHAIVRDVAYEQIPRARASDKHRRTAGWLESLSPERSEDRGEMLAHHYLRALRYSPAGERRDDSLRWSGHGRALRDAGDRSLSLNAFAEAARFFTEALALWPEDAPGRATLAFRLGRARDACRERRRRAARGGPRRVPAPRAGQEQAAEAMVLIGELLWMRGDPGAFAAPRGGGRAARAGRRRPYAKALRAEQPVAVQHDRRP